MNRIVEVLCRRDNISVAEAIRQVNEVQEKIEHCNMSYDEVETILAEDLGLEMDYIFDIIGGNI